MKAKRNNIKKLQQFCEESSLSVNFETENEEEGF